MRKKVKLYWTTVFLFCILEISKFRKVVDFSGLIPDLISISEVNRAIYCV